MDLSTAFYDRTRNVVIVHGRLYTVKQQRNRYYIHADNRQITVSDIVNNKEDEDDLVFNYVFGGLFQDFPCPAVDYWIMRWRLKRKISVKEYKKIFLSK